MPGSVPRAAGVPAERDAFGAALMAHQKGEDSRHFAERDDNYLDCFEGAGMYFADWGQWPDYEKAALAFARGRVLDVGVGAGRHAIYLQKKGMDVTGIDDSPLAIRVCRERGLGKALVLPFEKAGSFPRGSFDTVIMFCNNFGLFGGASKAKRMLGVLRRITSQGALLLAASNDPYQTDDPCHLKYHRAMKERGRMCGQVRIRVRFRTLVGKWFDYLMVSREEMAGIVAGTGWEIRRFISSEGSQYIAMLVRE